jgi:hypothetical protein
MMAHKCKADNSYGLEYSWPDNGEALCGIAFQIWCNVGSFNDDRDNNDDHADEGKSRCPGEFVYVSVEGEGVRDAAGAEGDDELPVSEYREDGYVDKVWEYRAYYVGYCITWEM